MPASEVANPIINPPYEEPGKYWKIHEHKPAELLSGRRKPTYIYRPPSAATDPESESEVGCELELPLVSQLRERLAEWRPLALRGEGGVTRVTMQLLNHWRRDGRHEPLFFAQLEAAETIIFLTEARADFLQGVDLPLDEPGAEKLRAGYTAFKRQCCKMATGTGKTTVMAMLAAWSILNKVNNRRDSRFSDAVLVICPNVTIRDRLTELDPKRGAASIYRTRDLVPTDMMSQLAQGRMLTVNWHVFEPHAVQSGSKIVKAGRLEIKSEVVYIGEQNTTARGRRYMTELDLRKQHALELLHILQEYKDKGGLLQRADIESQRYLETDAAMMRRVLDQELGTRKRILVFNDEAHHAYRLHPEIGDRTDSHIPDDEAQDYYYDEATVWVDGLDRIHKQRGINFCVDFSATPYFLGRAGENTNRIFPWTVSDFNLQEAIESGLVKIPQMAVRDPSGAQVPGYFNIWQWILPKLSPIERGGRKSEVKPEAVLKYAHTPIAMMGGMWEQQRQALAESSDARDDPRPPVFIIVCKTKKLAKLVYEWLGEGGQPTPTIPAANFPSLQNSEDTKNTICVYSDIQKELDSGNTSSDENRWMRHTLATIGKIDWPRDTQGRPQFPDGFDALATKLGRAQHPPGRDVRCIVSVGMLTEGWDCNTVTHIIGLRPFMSQLLCEQVIGRGLRRASYEIGEDGLMGEEIASVLGVPLSAYTLKAAVTNGDPTPKPIRHRVYAVPGREEYALSLPRVEGYQQMVCNRITCDMEKIAPLDVNSELIPSEVQTQAGIASNTGRLSLFGPGRSSVIDLQEFREKCRVQQRVYEMALALLKHYSETATCQAPSHTLFPQLFQIVKDYIDTKVSAPASANIKDSFLAPYYGWIIERLLENIQPDDTAGEVPELPRYEKIRGPALTADVDFSTNRALYPVQKSHLNAVVSDTEKLEQRAAYRLDMHDGVAAFVKNDHLGFGIPYIHNEEMHEYQPDFIIRLADRPDHYLILETKGFDMLKEVKQNAAERWVKAVNAEGSYGDWQYHMVFDAKNIDAIITQAIQSS